MIIAIPDREGRISPVFDVAHSLWLVEIDGGRERRRSEWTLEPTDPLARATRLREWGVDRLICGAISWPLEMALSAVGIEVIGLICGPTEEVLRAFREGELAKGAYRMPGCCRRARERDDRAPRGCGSEGDDGGIP